MAPTDSTTIIRTFTDPTAPTSQGRTHVTADGRVWREVLTSAVPVGPNERLGYVVGNRIVPDR